MVNMRKSTKMIKRLSYAGNTFGYEALSRIDMCIPLFVVLYGVVITV